MTSRDHKRGSPISRRIIWLAVFIILAICGYYALWVYLAERLGFEVDRNIASLGNKGITISCDGRDIRGFPFRMGVFCDDVALTIPDENIAASAKELRSAAQIYAPRMLVMELDGPLEADLPGLVPVKMDWELLHASARLDKPLPSALSIEGRDLTANTLIGNAPLFTVENSQLHMRVNGNDIDLAGNLAGLRLANMDADSPPLEAEANLTVLDGLLLAASPESLATNGYRTEIRSLSLSFGPDTAIGASGPFSVDVSGLIDAQLTLTARRPDAIARFLTMLFPEKAREINMAASGVAMLGNAPSLPLHIAKGRASIAFVTLGDIPALKP